MPESARHRIQSGPLDSFKKLQRASISDFLLWLSKFLPNDQDLPVTLHQSNYLLDKQCTFLSFTAAANLLFLVEKLRRTIKNAFLFLIIEIGTKCGVKHIYTES